MLKRIYHYFLDKYLAQCRRPYLAQLDKIVGENTSVISSNCFAGRILQDLGRKYNTPTLGLYFWSSDYIEFLKHLRYYLFEAKLTFVEQSKYSLGNERRKKWKHWYPIGNLDGRVEIHFLHYHSESEAYEKWNRRAARVNFDNLVVVGMEQNLCTMNHILEFDELPFVNKVFFSTKECETSSNIHITEFDCCGEVGDPYKKGHVFYKYLVEMWRKNESNVGY
ncbi:MAG: DUF1919 domain-containing protein [archaeon]|nr:DUF1919 domain-containing protein [archaeon]